ncbi:uncharacterized protein NEMAJ01_1132 [Nematocida major]|uniref:uncharacterized protein n=1 Tax=Nematocida major TaxID=1912982 RepID=UPI0020088953|nr:uncharacterized protein NEMAJ01_1132 [Nematocida major]KAH9386236.1 hypothetical protein NEMAJ01_1132 [Nematocida major]
MRAYQREKGSIELILKTFGLVVFAAAQLVLGAQSQGVQLGEDLMDYQNQRDLANILNELRNGSEIARNLVSSFAQANEDAKKKEELEQSLESQASRENAASAAVNYSEGVFAPKDGIASAPRTAESEDAEAIQESLAELQKGILNAKNCGVCCACKRKTALNLGLKIGSHCCSYVIREIERILNKHSQTAQRVDATTDSISRVLDGLFKGADTAASSFEVTDMVKRIMDLPSERMVLKVYLAILLDSIMFDLCNNQNCALCKALYQYDSFSIYRVVRATSVFGQSKDTLGTNLGRLSSGLKSVKDACMLFNGLQRVFMLLRLNSGIFSLRSMNESLGVSNTGADVNARFMLNTFNLAVVLNSTDMMYYFMQANGSLIPIPNVDNMNLGLYNMVSSAGIDWQGAVNSQLRLYENAGTTAYAEQPDVVSFLQNDGLFIGTPRNVEVKVTHTIPVQNLQTARQKRSVPVTAISSAKAVPLAEQAPQFMQGVSPLTIGPTSIGNVLVAPVQQPCPSVCKKIEQLSKSGSIYGCQKTNKLSGMADNLALALASGNTAPPEVVAQPGILKKSTEKKTVQFARPPQVRATRAAMPCSAAKSVSYTQMYVPQQAPVVAPQCSMKMPYENISVPVVSGLAAPTMQAQPVFTHAPSVQRSAAPLNPTVISSTPNNSTYGFH